MVNFSGKWVFDHAENMEAVAAKLNVNPANIPADRSSTQVIDQQGDNFHVTTTAGGKTRDISFKVGETFIDPDIKALRGVDVEVTPQWDGDKLKATGPKGNWASRELRGNQMVITFSFDGVTGSRFFNKA